MVKSILRDRIFLAKEVYMNKSENVDENEDTIAGDHIRLKIVPTSCVKHTSSSMSIQPMGLYKHLYDIST